MFTFGIIAYVLIIHNIFDFWLQNRWMATNKSKSNVALTSHVGIYSIGLVLIAMGFLDDLTISSYFGFVVGNAFLHWGTDYISSRITTRYYQENKMHMFWGVIGVDQLIHALTLFGTIHLLTN